LSRKRSLSGLLILFVLLLTASPWVVRWVQRTFLEQNLTLELKREAAIPYSGNWSILPGQEGVYVVRNAEIRYFHTDQEKDWGFSTETLVPVVGTNRNHLFLLEANPRYLLRIDEQGYMLYQQATNRSAEVITADQESHVLVQHPLENRLIPFSILDPEGRVMGSILLTEGEVLDTTITSEHNRVYVVVLRLTANGYESALLGYDMQGVLQTTRSFPEQIVVDTMIMDSGEVAVLTDSQMTLLSIDMEESWTTPLEPYYLSAYDGSGRWALAHRRELYTAELPLELEGNTVLTYLKLEERESILIGQEEELTELMVRDQQLLTRAIRKITVYQEDGGIIDEQMFQNEVEDAFLLSNDQLAVILRGQVVFYELQQDE